MISKINFPMKKTLGIRHLFVPYSEKNEVKALGAKWDSTNRKWYCFNSQSEIFEKWHNERVKIYIKSRYDDRMIVKALGCEWDKERRLWYCHEDNTEALEKLEKAETK